MTVPPKPELETDPEEIAKKIKAMQDMQYAALTASHYSNYYAVTLEKRIAKAREILTASIPQSRLALEIIRAVEALDGE